MARVTLAISTFNSEQYLRNCLEQLCHQSLIGHCEVIVVDSGSEQNEMSVCRSFEGRFRKLRYLRTGREPLYAAWNRMLEMSLGEFFVNVNTDDSLAPNALEWLVAAMDANPGASLAFGDWVWSARPNPDYPWNPSYRRIRHEAYHPRIPLFYCFTGCHQFWRKADLCEIGGFNPARRAAGDYEAAATLIAHRRHAVYIPQAISGFFFNTQGLSLSSSRSVDEANEIQNELWRKLRIADVFKVDEDRGRKEAAAWCELGWQSLDVFVPWADIPVDQSHRALECAARADELRLGSPGAALLRAFARSREAGAPKGWGKRLFLWLRRNLKKKHRARTPSPLFIP